MSTRELRNLSDRFPDMGDLVDVLADRIAQRQLLRRRAHRQRQYALRRQALSSFECALEDAVHRSEHARSDDPDLQFACRDLHERLGNMRFRPTSYRTADRIVTFIEEARDLWRGELEAAGTAEELAESLTRAVDHVQDFLLGVEAIHATKPATTRDTKHVHVMTYEALAELAGRHHQQASVALRDVRGWQEIERRTEHVATDEARSGAPLLFGPDIPQMV